MTHLAEVRHFFCQTFEEEKEEGEVIISYLGSSAAAKTPKSRSLLAMPHLITEGYPIRGIDSDFPAGMHKGMGPASTAIGALGQTEEDGDFLSLVQL